MPTCIGCWITTRFISCSWLTLTAVKRQKQGICGARTPMKIIVVRPVPIEAQIWTGILITNGQDGVDRAITPVMKLTMALALPPSQKWMLSKMWCFPFFLTNAKMTSTLLPRRTLPVSTLTCIVTEAMWCGLGVLPVLMLRIIPTYKR